MKRTFKIFGKSLWAVLEIAGAFFLVFLALVIFVLWKLSGGPVDVTFAADYVKAALVSKDDNAEMAFDSIVAEWPEYDGPIILGMGGVKILEQGKTVLEVPRLGVKIAKTPLLIGLVKPVALIVTEPTLKLYRGDTGDFHLFVTSAPSPETNAPEQNITFRDIGQSFFKGGNLPDYPALKPLSQLERVIVKNAVILVDDHQAGISWDVPDVTFDLKREARKFDLSLTYKEKEEAPLSELSLALEKQSDGKEIGLDTTLHNVNSAMLARVMLPFHSLRDQKFVIDGKVTGTLDEKWMPQSLDAKISSDKGSLSLEALQDVPLTFSKLSANMVLDKATGVFEIKDTKLDVNGATIALSGKKQLGSDDPYFPVTLSISDLEFSTINSLWPEAQKITPLGEWMTGKLSDAKITDLKVTLPVNIGDLTDIPAEKIEAGFKYENLKADYRAPMIHVEKAKGSATIKGDVLDIVVDSGKIADLVVNKGRVSITHLAHPTEIGDVTIDADLSGPVATILDYIEREPIYLGEEKIGLKKEEVKGAADAQVHVVFPALRDLPADDVKVAVKGTIRDVLLPKIVRGLDITGGPFTVDVAGPQFTIAGQGRLNGRDIDLTYSEYIEPKDAPYVSKITAKLVSDQALREHFGVNLSQFVEGSVPLDIDYQEPKKGQIDIGIVADLTPAKVFIDPLGYLKKAGVKGTATATALIRNDDIDSVKDLKIDIDGNTHAIGTVKFGKVGKDWDVSKVDFPVVKIGKVSDFSLKLAQPQKDQLDIAITGKKFDGRSFLGGGDKDAKADKKKREEKNKDSGPAVNATVDVPRMITGDDDDQFLSAPKVKLSTNENGDVTYLDLKGNTPNGMLTVSLKPNKYNRMEMTVLATNAGEALHALDLYDQMVGGKMEVRGKQISGGAINDIEGQGQITDFTVVKAPVLAKLINLFSISGLTELLQNKGIGFSKLKTGFEWKEVEKGRMIILKKGRTSGASIGLSFEGAIDQTDDTMDLGGTVVPMS
ncbi:MAG TPA: DUF3971 domain-containing protein, partial [Alphaproteobacteria bacterium]|nr:DUF3971 domain-containing protein [Alphaproteobacteria bacterium]